MADEEEEDIENGYDAFEEIQVYEESETDSSSSEAGTEDEDGTRPINITYDPALPTRHQYLGEEMDEFSGRTVLEPNNFVELPLMVFPTVVLVPGQTLPLHLFHPQAVAMMKNVIDKDRTFGLVNSKHGVSQNQLKETIGTTVEIFSMKEEVEAGITTMIIKATGRQRFKIVDLRRQVDGVLMAKVLILPEIMLSSHPEGGLVSCYHKSGCQATCKGSLERLRPTFNKSRLGSTKKNRVNTSLSCWPAWVYRLYDPFSLMDEVKKELQRWSQTIRLDNVPKDPIDFSYWVAANLPLDDSLKLQLLYIDSTTERLHPSRVEFFVFHQHLKRYMNMDDSRTKNSTPEGSEMEQQLPKPMSMSLDGPLAAYVNPSGWVHETLTFYKANGIRLRGRPTAENSWFPGYAWTIAECMHCHNHLGWRFTSVKKGLSPSKFWGLTRASLKPGMRSDAEEDQPQSPPPSQMD